MNRTKFALIAGAVLAFAPSFVLTGPAWSDGASLQHGRAIAKANCARCHNIDKRGESPFSPAPPFRVIAKMYAASDLEEALVEGIVVGHPAMPEFTLSGEEAAALSGFIDSLGR